MHKDKVDQKLFNQQSEFDKLKASLKDTKKQWDAIVSECTHLASEIDHLKPSAEEFENGRL